jgi:hypothetical protein
MEIKFHSKMIAGRTRGSDVHLCLSHIRRGYKLLIAVGLGDIFAHA